LFVRHIEIGQVERSQCEQARGGFEKARRLIMIFLIINI